MPKTFKDFVQEAKQRIEEVTAEEVKARLDAGERFTLVDVREDGEWAEGRLPRALHLGRGVLERDALKILPDPGAEIVCYCGGGARSALTADVLGRMGYLKVTSMAGGFGAWRDRGFEIEK